MTQAANSNRVRGFGLVTLAALAALLSATGRPEADALAGLTGAGVPQGIAIALLHATPVVLIVGAIVLGQWLGKGRTQGMRWVIYGVFGAFAGAGMAFALDLFAGVPELAARLTGPLAEATLLDSFLWILAAYCITMGGLIGAIAFGGRPAVAALQIDEADAECLEVRRLERRVYAWASFATITIGVACAALAVGRQADEAARLAPVVVAFITAFASAFANYRLWSGFDEMQRRHVVEGYAYSGAFLTLAAFVWAGLQALGYAPGLDAVGVFLALVLVQMIATSYVTSMAVGHFSTVGKPA
jgi:hypothetical protein